MTKYPIKHTMEFGEEICPECADAGFVNIEDYYDDCEMCHGEGTIPLSVTFDLIADCPECQGKEKCGWYGEEKREYCPRCLTTGKVHRYWTPSEAAEHIKKETGIDWEPTAVWMIHHDDTPFLRTYKRAKDILTIKSRYTGILLVADFGQPAPPADCSPE